MFPNRNKRFREHAYVGKSVFGTKNCSLIFIDQVQPTTKTIKLRVCYFITFFYYSCWVKCQVYEICWSSTKFFGISVYYWDDYRLAKFYFFNFSRHLFNKTNINIPKVQSKSSKLKFKLKFKFKVQSCILKKQKRTNTVKKPFPCDQCS